MPILYMNKYTGIFDPGNTKQSVMALNLIEAAQLLSNTIEGTEPIILQCVEKNVAIGEIAPTPIYMGGEARRMDISPVYIGVALSPMIMAPTIPEDITGRTYFAGVNNALGVNVALMEVTIVDVLNGVVSLGMSAIETARLAAGEYNWHMTYSTGTTGPFLIWAGRLTAIRL